jgi:hypothetical protein
MQLREFFQELNIDCLWHIMRKFLEKFGAHDHCDDIMSALNTYVYDYLTVNEFEEN